MDNKKSNSEGLIIFVAAFILILVVLYFAFFRDDGNNMSNTLNDNNVNIYENSIYNNNLNNNNKDIEILDANAKEFYERVKNGITLNGKLIDIPAEYITRLTNKIGVEGYKLSESVKNTINSKFDEIENTLKENNVSDINEIDEQTKKKIDGLIDDIERAL